MCVSFVLGGQRERVTTTPKVLLTSVVGVGMGECGWVARAGKWEWLGDEEQRIAER